MRRYRKSPRASAPRPASEDDSWMTWVDPRSTIEVYEEEVPEYISTGLLDQDGDEIVYENWREPMGFRV